MSVLLAAAFAACPAFAASEGQEDLDKATESRLTANTLTELNNVISLIESAQKKGLDDVNTQYANKLLSTTLIQRAKETIKQIFTEVSSPEVFRQRFQSAKGDLERAVKLDPKQPEAFMLIAQLNLLPGGTGLKGVREAVDKAIELGIEDPAERSKAFALRARLQEKPEAKLADFDEAVRLMPDDASTVRERGLALADMEKYEQALVDLDKAITLAPEDGPSYEAKAIVLSRLKKYDDALAALDKAQQLSPDSEMPLLHRSRVHIAQGKLDAALEDLKKALAINPGNLTVLMLRASVYQEKGEKEKAMADIDQALTIKPDLPMVVRTRALMLAEDNRFDEAIGELEKLYKLNPKDMLTVLQLGVLYSAQKKSAKAIEYFDILLAQAPNEWRALEGRGDSYLNIGKQAEAVADYEKAIKLQPKESGLLNNLAWVLATSPDDKLRDGKRAIQLATEACELTEYKAAHILSTLAAAYAETGDFDSAVKWSTKAVEIGEKDHDEDLKKELENYKAKKPIREVLTEEKPADKPTDKPADKPTDKPAEKPADKPAEK
jgi:tetratricopeptide (TPR) repeat protein